MTKETEDENTEIDKGGRPKIEVNMKVLKALMQFKVTRGFVADYLEVSETVIDARIKEHFNLTFKEYGSLQKERTGYKLQQKAIEMALKGDRTMIIFSLKNMAKWSDKIEQKQTSEDIVINIDSDDANL